MKKTKKTNEITEITETNGIVYLQSITTIGIPVNALNENDAKKKALEVFNKADGDPYCYFNMTGFKCVEVDLDAIVND